MQQFRECLRVLQEELGAPPLEETVELYEQIKAGKLDAVEPHRALAPIVPVQFDSAAKLPLVGRQDELAQIQAIYSGIEKNSKLVLVEGEAGIGKTRLVEEFLARSSANALQARCYPGESTVAYRPWIDALRNTLAGSKASAKLEELQSIWLTEAARLLPEISDLFPHIDRPSPDLPARSTRKAARTVP